MNTEFQNVTGFRGEKITELVLTDYSSFPGPLFQPGFLGDKWPSIDFYVELNDVPGQRPYFFVQTRSTRSTTSLRTHSLKIQTRKEDIEKLLRIPGPTYIIGVHEPSKRAFIRSVHAGPSPKVITKISVANELTSDNLLKLHAEVRMFWNSIDHKPKASVFL